MEGINLITEVLERTTKPQKAVIIKMLISMQHKPSDRYGFIAHQRGKTVCYTPSVCRLLSMTPAEVMEVDYFTVPDKGIRDNVMRKLADQDTTRTIYMIEGRRIRVTSIYLEDFSGINMVEDISHFPPQVFADKKIWEVGA